jgi:hypothetical protein
MTPNIAPPSIAIVRIETPHWRLIPIWLPLFLLWIPAILLSPLIFLVIFGLAIAGLAVNVTISPWRAFRILWDIVCSLPGTHVRVTTDGSHIQVRIL